MELTVLGKYGPYPKAGTGAASGYLVSDGGVNLALDMGSGTLARLQQMTDISRLDGIFISHLHYDHTSDLLPLRYLLEDLDRTLTVYTAYEDSEWYKLLFGHPNLKVVNVDSSSVIRLGSLTLRFYDMLHTVPCLAVRIEGSKTLVYTGDTMYNDNILAALVGADCALADCSKPDGFNGPHMTVSIAKKLNAETGVRIISTHLSPDYSPEEEYKEFPGISVAEELKTYKI